MTKKNVELDSLLRGREGYIYSFSLWQLRIIKQEEERSKVLDLNHLLYCSMHGDIKLHFYLKTRPQESPRLFSCHTVLFSWSVLRVLNEVEGLVLGPGWTALCKEIRDWDREGWDCWTADTGWTVVLSFEIEDEPVFRIFSGSSLPFYSYLHILFLFSAQCNLNCDTVKLPFEISQFQVSAEHTSSYIKCSQNVFGSY